MSVTVCFRARRVLTMDPSRPGATHVAVRDGRILGVGSAQELSGWGPMEPDDTFRDRVLMPGLVEGHCHAQEGGVWSYPYAGYYDRRGPDGTLWPGLTSIDAVVARLKEVDARMDDPAAPLVAWGFDPIFLGGPRMCTRDLDRVSQTRPIVVVHANFHLLNANSAVLRRAGIGPDTPIDGVLRDEHGVPTGELKEFAAMFHAFQVTGGNLLAAAPSDTGLRDFGRVAQLAGVTTATDLFADISEDYLALARRVTADPAFPLRLVPALNAMSRPSDEGIALLKGLAPTSTDKLRLGRVKLMTDGSIQGFTGRLKWPGYYDGHENGMWNIAPEQLKEVLLEYHRAGMQVHVHANGDEASEVSLDAIEHALREAPRPDHRHTVQHCQMADAAQFRRMRALGACANLFANHVYYWGDAHYATTMGPDRAQRLDACATALREGVPLAIHSDAPVTPIAPLFTAWCAVNRLTSSGRVLGEGERIGVAEALRAITLGAAYTLRLDHEIGSIEVGKRADFCVLEDDPTEVDPVRLKEVRVWGTVLGGRVFRAPAAA